MQWSTPSSRKTPTWLRPSSAALGSGHSTSVRSTSVKTTTTVRGARRPYVSVQASPASPFGRRASTDGAGTALATSLGWVGRRMSSPGTGGPGPFDSISDDSPGQPARGSPFDIYAVFRPIPGGGVFSCLGRELRPRRSLAMIKTMLC